MSKNPLAIVILAAGRGTRMKSEAPKVMHRLAGRPMINWLLDEVQNLSPEKIIVVTGPDMEELEEACPDCIFAVQKKALGTADALKSALPELKNFKGDVLVLLGDTPLITRATLEALIDARRGAGITVLGVERHNPTGYGRLIIDKNGLLDRIVEEKDASAEERKVKLVNTGAFCMEGARIKGWLDKVDNKNRQGEYYITDLPAIAAKEGYLTRVHITLDGDEVRGCNTRTDQANLENTLQGRLRSAHMNSGIKMLDPSTVYLHHDTVIAPGVVIEPNVFFGPGVSVAENAHIRAFCYFENVKIGKDTVIGPFARLRPGTEIGEGARIGNFVEVKNAQIGKGSKINHLSYVGDCTMGAETNFGAGAITVNYDGFDKHRTEIGKGVMIGSNANLIAPVRIEDGAFVAAGSTVSDDVPADALGISRAALEIVKDWAKDYRQRKKTKCKS